MARDPYDLSCVIHVHSTYSDGTANVAEIIDAARDAGRDAVLLTDHDSLGARRGGWEGWHDGVLLLVGTEVSPPGGHLLAFGVEHELDHAAISEGAIPAAVVAAGGFGFAAHPFSRGSAMSKRIGRPHPWVRLRDSDLTGIELWSLATDSAESWRSPGEAVRFLRDPEAEIVDPPAPNLESWDSLLAERPTVAIGGLDAHQTGVRIRGRVRSPMPNRDWFGLLGTHVLLTEEPRGDLEPDRDAVYSALRHGRCYISRDSLGDPRGFGFWAESGSDRHDMGENAPHGEWAVRVRLPRPAQVSLIRNGETIGSAHGDLLEWPAAEGGVYRVAVHVQSRGALRTWILSNAIRIDTACS